MVTAVAAPNVDEAAVRAALADVADPEIPAISIVDLGIVERVEVAGDTIRVELLPTFVGCPALDAIGAAVEERLAGFGRPVEVRFGFSVPWTTDRITEQDDAISRSRVSPRRATTRAPTAARRTS